jgi:hypothetical protein
VYPLVEYEIRKKEFDLYNLCLDHYKENRVGWVEGPFCTFPLIFNDYRQDMALLSKLSGHKVVKEPLLGE